MNLGAWSLEEGYDFDPMDKLVHRPHEDNWYEDLGEASTLVPATEESSSIAMVVRRADKMLDLQCSPLWTSNFLTEVLQQSHVGSEP